MIRTYIASGKTLEAFHACDDFVRSIIGPVGSGKTSACCAEIIRRAHEQQPSPDGRRRSRWAAIRNTYGELRTTTIKTWEHWFPQILGRFSLEAPITHRLVTDALDIEVLFLALDRPADVAKLLSLELTGGWINEAREGAEGRHGRPDGARGPISAGLRWGAVVVGRHHGRHAAER